ncbi:alpha/beta-hydrolase [Punctularia strigosozonata HHB-11173 SS5]|uniref:alpha/beta-hydrolase n=1 Tax=Punctularia strigosozonata (strain HHB-11173) TaxID=741275 RepID=UPI0004417F98|nr:alpha/beta-hydrolase [Punctularia strigosozonata HHB-11173 SS5]EIN13723.1 alpha/beta-hydrolase [Punctularia strigosozonata HHB-11173 SS5]
MPLSRVYKLTEAQKLMYNAEKEVNFRWIAKVFATRSSYLLSENDRASPELVDELAELGEFAEVAYGFLPITTVFEQYDVLSQNGFPLAEHRALRGGRLVTALMGDVASLKGYIAFRPERNQLVIAFSGTQNWIQALYDVHGSRRRYPLGRGCKVHRGFWKLYCGIRKHVVEGIQNAREQYSFAEVVFAGHSMGAAMAYLTSLEALNTSDMLPPGVTIKLAAFGGPRVGNKRLCEFWRESVERYRSTHGSNSLQEYFVKAYNDGVPALPPERFGYKHFCQTPLYLAFGRMYHVPISECEYSSMSVAESELDSDEVPFPRGGHNYYNGRNMERLARRMDMLAVEMTNGPGWEDRYRTKMMKSEGRFGS